VEAGDRRLGSLGHRRGGGAHLAGVAGADSPAGHTDGGIGAGGSDAATRKLLLIQ